MSQKIYTAILFSAVSILFIACDTGFKKLFTKQTAREKYIDYLKKRSPGNSTTWAAIGDKALKRPAEISAPYAEAGYFSGRMTDAVAFRFSAKGGQAISIQFSPTGNNGLAVFADLWNGADTAALDLLRSADTSEYEIKYSSIYDESYLLRLQPAAMDSGNFTLKINLSPMLDFPIPPSTKSNIGSFWGAGRDGGARSHEGIDIFAKKGSETVAVADGFIARTGVNNLGGKVVWLRPTGQNFSVYYAHLDSQLVQPGQSVKAGDPVGHVGNTGNAKFTPAHLHFGIYTRSGAVNPLPFVQSVDPLPAPAAKSLNQQYLVSKSTSFYPGPSRKNSFSLQASDTIVTEAATGSYYRVVLPDSSRAFIPTSSLSTKMKL